MDKNNIIGLTLIFILFFVWAEINAPSKEEMKRAEFVRDSIQTVKENALKETKTADLKPETPAVPENLPDSVKNVMNQAKFGEFAANANGTETESILENEVMKITFTNKGGRIKAVELKGYQKVAEDKDHNEVKTPLILLEDEKNRFDYDLPASVGGGKVNSGDLFFNASKDGKTITFKADAGGGRFFEQKYAIKDSSYNINYNVELNGIPTEALKLTWINYLDKLEKNDYYERNYTSVYYKPVDDDANYCSCASDDSEDIDGEPVKWVSHSNQFFNSSLIASSQFKSAVVGTKMLDEDNNDLKMMSSELNLPLQNGAFAMNMYVGPNKYENLQNYNNGLENIIPFGWSIFGTVNRWIIRPLFNFLSLFISNKGIVILLLTFLVKLVLFPLTYKMLYSQSKMGALKPQIEKLTEKHGDDAQKKQMETMKLYREFGVNPLGGCMPMFLQMPIWIALYRFFPASIEFRQAPFLWATDLSSYDVFFRLPFEMPMGMGAHLSLFTLLWAITTLIYTYYNTRHMDMSANPAMKYMQYAMPVMFMGFFNSFASGLTCYLFFSNIINIGQTIITKEVIIDKDKIQKEFEDYKKKPKKKGGFQERLETALKEQQRIAAEQQAKGKKKK